MTDLWVTSYDRIYIHIEIEKYLFCSLVSSLFSSLLWFLACLLFCFLFCSLFCTPFCALFDFVLRYACSFRIYLRLWAERPTLATWRARFQATLTSQSGCEKSYTLWKNPLWGLLALSTSRRHGWWYHCSLLQGSLRYPLLNIIPIIYILQLKSRKHYLFNCT